MIHWQPPKYSDLPIWKYTVSNGFCSHFLLIVHSRTTPQSLCSYCSLTDHPAVTFFLLFTHGPPRSHFLLFFFFCILTHKAPPIICSRRQFQIFAPFPKITNKAWYFMRIVHWHLEVHCKQCFFFHINA